MYQRLLWVNASHFMFSLISNKARCGWLFIDGNVDVTQQSIPIFHTRSAKGLLCELKALAAKMEITIFSIKLFSCADLIN